MINKTKFLKEHKIAGGRLAKEINKLILNWHIYSNLHVGANEIHDSLLPELHIAVEYWKNLVTCEAEGFRDAANNKAFHHLLREVIKGNEEINYFGVLCPSYKKGKRAKGFSDQPGNTTYRAYANLKRMVENTRNLGIKCNSRMFFADVSIERCEDLTKTDWEDFERIIVMDGIIAKTHGIPYQTLTEFAPQLKQIVGREGKFVDVNDLPVSKKAVERSMWRDRQFYPAMFGWSIKEAENRTLIHAHSYFWQGHFIREELKYPVMVYSAYDYEKGALYNGPDGLSLPAIIYPKKDESNPANATIPNWSKSNTKEGVLYAYR